MIWWWWYFCISDINQLIIEWYIYSDSDRGPAKGKETERRKDSPAWTMYSGLTAPCERYYWKYNCTDYFVGFDINLNSNVWAAAYI